MDTRAKTVYGIKSFNKETITLDLSTYPELNPYLVAGMLITTATLAFVFPVPTFISIMLLFIIVA